MIGMVSVQRSFVVLKPVDVVVGYLKDFANAEQWDPGTISCVRTDSGPVQVGSTWHNVSEFRGKDTALEYRLDVLEPDHVVFVGENKTATSRDDLTFAGHDGQTRITYHAEIEFHGIAKLAGPLLQREFEKLADGVEETMTRRINAL